MTEARPTIGELAAALDARDVTLDALREAFPGWVLWHSEVTGCHHARRDDGSGRFTERESDRRRFHVAASSPGRLAVLLLGQAAADAEQEGGSTDQRGDEPPPH